MQFHVIEKMTQAGKPYKQPLFLRGLNNWPEFSPVEAKAFLRREDAGEAVERCFRMDGYECRVVTMEVSDE